MFVFVTGTRAKFQAGAAPRSKGPAGPRNSNESCSRLSSTWAQETVGAFGGKAPRGFFACSKVCILGLIGSCYCDSLPHCGLGGVSGGKSIETGLRTAPQRGSEGSERSLAESLATRFGSADFASTP